MTDKPWAIGVDLGGTKIEVAEVDVQGTVGRRIRVATDVRGGADRIEGEVATAVKELLQGERSAPAAIGVGVAGQIEPLQGAVEFSPNLNWHEIPLQADLNRVLGIRVIVTNDVRAAVWGEWFHGAGCGYDDLVCLFVGTGIGGGVVSGGRMLTGYSNVAGELGHLTVDLDGPMCHCGNRGCLEALAGGWAIARRARAAIEADPAAGDFLTRLANSEKGSLTAETVGRAALAGDPLAQRIVDETAEALIAGCVGLTNAFNPRRFILGGGVIEGLPQLIDRVASGVRQRALAAACTHLEVIGAALHCDAGVIGAATLAMQ
jgi:glucokinase